MRQPVAASPPTLRRASAFTSSSAVPRAGSTAPRRHLTPRRISSRRFRAGGYQAAVAVRAIAPRRAGRAAFAKRRPPAGGQRAASPIRLRRTSRGRKQERAERWVRSIRATWFPSSSPPTAAACRCGSPILLLLRYVSRASFGRSSLGCSPSLPAPGGSLEGDGGNAAQAAQRLTDRTLAGWRGSFVCPATRHRRSPMPMEGETGE